MIYVKPAPGGRIRQPDRNFRPMPETGDFVDKDDVFYGRLLATGDVIAVDAPDKPKEPPAKKGDK